LSAPTNHDKIRIEKRIPIPVLCHKDAKYPWGKLEIGDSFLVPGKRITSITSGMRRARRRYKKKFTARTVKGGVRVWRVA